VLVTVECDVKEIAFTARGCFPKEIQMTRRLQAIPVFALMGVIAFLPSCLRAHFALHAVQTAGLAFGCWLVLTSVLFCWPHESDRLRLITTFGTHAMLMILMMCFATQFAPAVVRVSTLMFSSWFVLASTVMFWVMGNDQPRVARSQC
jgi:hypothetical protein